MREPRKIICFWKRAICVLPLCGEDAGLHYSQAFGLQELVPTRWVSGCRRVEANGRPGEGNKEEIKGNKEEEEWGGCDPLWKRIDKLNDLSKEGEVKNEGQEYVSFVS